MHDLQYHAESYDKDENRSEKQKHKEWAVSLMNEFIPVKDVASKFIIQVKTILTSRESNQLDLLHQRIMAAIGYFDPLLKKFSGKVTEKINSLKTTKGIKNYLNELRETESLFVRQLKILIKAESLIGMALNEGELTKSEWRKSMAPFEKHNAGEISTKKNQSKHQQNEKKEKPDSKIVTLGLFKDGKTLQEIARERNLAVSTIEGHLASFVAKGELEATSFISQEKYDTIVAASKKLNTLQTGPVKVLLGPEYSYSDIRFALAGYLFSQQPS